MLTRREALAGLVGGTGILAGCMSRQLGLDVEGIDAVEIGAATVREVASLPEPLAEDVDAALPGPRPEGTGEITVRRTGPEAAFHALAVTDYLRSAGERIRVEGLYYDLEHSLTEYELTVAPVDGEAIDETATADAELTRRNQRTERVFANAIEAGTYRTTRVPEAVFDAVEGYEYLTLGSLEDADDYYEAELATVERDVDEDLAASTNDALRVTAVAPTDVDDARLYELADLPEEYREDVREALEDGDYVVSGDADLDFDGSRYDDAVYRFEGTYYFLSATEVA